MSRVLEIEPTKTEFLSAARGGNLVPISADLPADLETPISAFLKLRNGSEAFLLESVEGGEKVGRYSFIGAGPFLRLRASGDTIDIEEGGRHETRRGDPLTAVADLLRRYRPVAPPAGLPRFCE